MVIEDGVPVGYEVAVVFLIVGCLLSSFVLEEFLWEFLVVFLEAVYEL
jgi:hypothetical protein